MRVIFLFVVQFRDNLFYDFSGIVLHVYPGSCLPVQGQDIVEPTYSHSRRWAAHSWRGKDTSTRRFFLRPSSVLLSAIG